MCRLRSTDGAKNKSQQIHEYDPISSKQHMYKVGEQDIVEICSLQDNKAAEI